jgi:pimeloyl-ACP methyl ester carboxylesterase
MATAHNAGTEIHYEVSGEGTPVVLLHGFPDSGRLWRQQVPALTGAGYRVIVPDMRGYGRSTRPVEVDAYNILPLVSDVGAVLADAGVPRAHVVGHDWGAAVAWALASVAPDTVDRLVALSIGHPATFRGRPGQLDLDQLEKSWFMLLFQFPGVAEEWLSANQWTNFRTLFRHPDEDGVIADLEAKFVADPRAQLLPGHREPGVLPRPSTGPARSTGPNAGRLEQRRLRADRGPDDPTGPGVRRQSLRAMARASSAIATFAWERDRGHDPG